MELFDLKDLRELVDFLKSNDIAEFELNRGDQQVRLKFASAFPQPVQITESAHVLPHAAGSEALFPAAGTSMVSAAVAHAEPVEELHQVKSPIVGTFYESSAPGAQPFVRPGDTVEIGQVLCIVEAMKLMNEIECDVAGEIVRVIAKSGQPVEYGQALFAVRTR